MTTAIGNDGYLTAYNYIENAKKHDVITVRKMPLSPGFIIALTALNKDYKLYAW